MVEQRDEPLTLAILVATQIVGVCKGARDPQHTHGKLEKELHSGLEEEVEEVAVTDERQEGEGDVVGKVRRGCDCRGSQSG